MSAVRYVWWHKKGVTAHRATPLADLPTSSPLSTESKKARPLNNEMAYADTPKGAGINSGYAFDVAKLQKNTETTKDKEQKRALETASLPFVEDQPTVVSSADGAKVRIKLVLYQLLGAKLDIMSTFT